MSNTVVWTVGDTDALRKLEFAQEEVEKHRCHRQRFTDRSNLLKEFSKLCNALQDFKIIILLASEPYEI